MSRSIVNKHISYRHKIFIFRGCFIQNVKIYAYPNVAGVILLNGYNVGNPLRVSARSNEFYVE
jgi:hypothetical protein